MKARGYLGLPAQIQQLVLDGLDAEVANAQRKLLEAERSDDHDPEIAKAFRDDMTHANALREVLTSGRA